jgi:hypothetical protein
MSTWVRYGFACPIASLVGAAAFFVLAFIYKIPHLAEASNIFFMVLIEITYVFVLVFVLLIVGVAIVGAIVVALKIRRLWVHLLVALLIGLSLTAIGAIDAKPKPNSIVNIVLLVGPTIISVVTGWMFWWIAFGRDKGRLEPNP